MDLQGARAGEARAEVVMGVSVWVEGDGGVGLGGGAMGGVMRAEETVAEEKAEM